MALQAEWTKITPAIAVEYLTHAAPNRGRRKKVVEAYARDMEAGKWLSTGEPVLFTAAGEMIDGQHRMAAVVESGCTVEFLVVRGVSPNAIDVVDTGVARTFADVLTIQGRCGKNTAQVLGSLTRRMALWEAGIRFQSGSGAILTHSELAEYLVKHPELEDYATFAAGSTSHPPGVAATSFALIYGLCSQIDEAQAHEFCCRWRDGANLEAGSPILVLRDRIANNLLPSPGYFVSQNGMREVKVALAILAWNAFRGGRDAQSLKLPRGGLTNKNFPVPR